MRVSWRYLTAERRKTQTSELKIDRPRRAQWLNVFLFVVNLFAWNTELLGLDSSQYRNRSKVQLALIASLLLIYR